MQKRNRKTYVLTDVGDRKVYDALKKQDVKPRNRASWLAQKTEEFGDPISHDTTRKILSKQGVEESYIKYVFKALGLQGKVGGEWELVLRQNSDRPQPSTNPQNIPTSESIPELTTLEFIGRDRDLTNLTNLRKQHKIVLIKAGAGVGKSTLAREFLQTQFKKVIRIEMGLESGNVTPAEEKVSQILRKDFDEEPSRDFGINLDILREKLADRANPIGILIDNLEPALDENYRFREKLRGYDALLAVLGDRDVFSFTLITSRRSLITPRARVHEYSLEGLDITAWQQYFHDCENGADSEVLMQMCVAYNGNAKVMDILHGAIKNRFDGNIGAYWRRYKDALLADSELETLISVEMDWLRDNQPEAYKLLCRMGCYRYQDVKTVPFEGLICLLWDVPDSQRIGIVDYLNKNSLIEAKGEYYLHPAVREKAKSRLLEDNIDWETTNRKAAEFWIDNVKNIETVNEALKSLESVLHYLSIKDCKNACVVLTKNNENLESLARSFYRFGLHQHMTSLISSIFKDNNPDTEPFGSNLYNVLASMYMQEGNIHEALKCLSNAINLAIKFDDNPYLINSILNVSLCKLELWELDDSLKSFLEYEALCNQSTFMSEIFDKKFFSEQFTFPYCIALLHSLLGNNSKAHSYIKISHERMTSNGIFMSPWDQGYYFLFLGWTYKNLHVFDKAFEMYEEAIKFAKESNYTEVNAKALIGLAELSRLQRNFDKALLEYFESIKLLQNIGAKSALAEAYFQFGLTYQAMGEHDQAKKYKAKALELFAQMEAPKQIERVNKAFGGNIQ